MAELLFLFLKLSLLPIVTVCHTDYSVSERYQDTDQVGLVNSR
jgi:hypothetical protein